MWKVCFGGRRSGFGIAGGYLAGVDRSGRGFNPRPAPGPVPEREFCALSYSTEHSNFRLPHSVRGCAIFLIRYPMSRRGRMARGLFRRSLRRGFELTKSAMLRSFSPPISLSETPPPRFPQQNARRIPPFRKTNSTRLSIACALRPAPSPDASRRPNPDETRRPALLSVFRFQTTRSPAAPPPQPPPERAARIRRRPPPPPKRTRRTK